MIFERQVLSNESVSGTSERQVPGEMFNSTILPVKFLYLEVELALFIEEVEFNNVKMSDGCQKWTRDFCQWMEKSAIDDHAGEPNN